MDAMTKDTLPTTGLPSVLELGQRLARYEHAYHAYDLHGAYFERCTEPAREQARAVIYAHKLGLRQLIATIQPDTIGDVAVQIAEIVEASGDLAANKLSENQVTERANMIERLALSALPILAAAAGLDLEAMGWADYEHMRAQRWAALEAVACP